MTPAEETHGSALLSEARRAAELDDWEQCYRACDEGISLEDRLGSDAWIGLRLGLASVALNWEAANDPLIERAIREVKRVVTSDLITLEDQRLGAAFRYLGGLHKARLRGDKRSNLTSAFEYYEKALGVFREDRCPEDWALLKVNIALTIQKRVGLLGTNFLRSDPREIETAIGSVEYSVQACRDALRVYTAEAYPEEHEEAQALADNGRRLIFRLRALKNTG